MILPGFTTPIFGEAEDITYIGNAVGTGNNGANASIDISAISGISDGDFILVCSGAYSTGTSGLPTTDGSGSFTEVANTNRSGLASLRINYKFRSGDNTITITKSSGGGSCSGVVMIFRNVDSDDPLDQTTLTSNGSASSPDPPQIVTQTAKAYVIAAGSVSIYDTSPGTITNYSPVPHPIAAGNTTAEGDHSTAAAYRMIASPGTENPGTLSGWSGDINWVAGTAALKPAS